MSVVYFDQLSGAARTRKLVETFFSAVFFLEFKGVIRNYKHPSLVTKMNFLEKVLFFVQLSQNRSFWGFKNIFVTSNDRHCVNE